MGQARQRIAVLLDEHPLWLDALDVVVQRAGFDTVVKVTRPTAALAVVEERKPHLLVFEPRTSDERMEGLDCARRARERVPGMKAVAVAASEDMRDVETVLGAGVFAYVFKRAHREDLAVAVRQAFENSLYLANGHGAGRAPAADAATNAGLTRREAEILRYVAEGRSNKEVAKALWVTEQTVKFHLANVFRKLEVANRTQAGRWAHAHGLVGGTSPARPMFATPVGAH
jgi:DNA-binding NarL/FixJ family response regulator